MSSVKRIVSIIMVLTLFITVFSVFSLPASAATGKSKCYDVFTSKTITIQTENKGSPSIKFKCIGDASYKKDAKAPKLTLKVYNHSTQKTQTYRVSGYGNSIASTLKLNKNTKYTVNVSYWYNKNQNWGTYGIGMYRTSSWYTGQWCVASTSRLSYTIK